MTPAAGIALLLFILSYHRALGCWLKTADELIVLSRLVSGEKCYLTDNYSSRRCLQVVLYCVDKTTCLLIKKQVTGLESELFMTSRGLM